MPLEYAALLATILPEVSTGQRVNVAWGLPTTTFRYSFFLAAVYVLSWFDQILLFLHHFRHTRQSNEHVLSYGYHSSAPNQGTQLDDSYRTITIASSGDSYYIFSHRVLILRHITSEHYVVLVIHRCRAERRNEYSLVDSQYVKPFTHKACVTCPPRIMVSFSFTIA